MPNPANIQQLRTLLTQVPVSIGEKEQRELLAKISVKFPNHIQVASDQRAYKTYANCFAYAFSIYNDPLYRLICEADADLGTNKFFATSAFVKFLLNSNLIKQSDQGGLVLYSDAEIIKHAALKYNDTLIISKWGTGLIFVHPTWEIPATYGDRITSYELITGDIALAYFCRYLADMQDFDLLRSVLSSEDIRKILSFAKNA